MVSVGVHEFRNSLSRYLRLAREGETVVITRRKQPVAVLEGRPSCEAEYAKKESRKTTGFQANGKQKDLGR